MARLDLIAMDFEMRKSRAQVREHTLSICSSFTPSPRLQPHAVFAYLPARTSI